MTTNQIAECLIKDMSQRSFPIFLTTYQGQGMHEADAFGINRNGYMYEYEIKRSRSDFKAEFRNKKDKHERLATRRAIKVYDEWKNGKRTGGTYELILIPNRYFFACPEGLIRPGELPDYAGLAWISADGDVKIQKDAKLLHRHKANERIYERVAAILSQRMLYGCSYFTYQQKKEL